MILPEYVAEWLERAKRRYNIIGIYSMIERGEIPDNVKNWLSCGIDVYSVNDVRLNSIGRAYLDGYEVEKEKRYIVEIKGLMKDSRTLNRIVKRDEWFFGDSEDSEAVRTHHTEKELKNAGFGFVFDSGIAKEVEE